MNLETFNLRTLNAKDLVQSKILLFGEELILYRTIPTFNTLSKESF